MAIAYISRTEHFSAAHRLHSNQLSDEDNKLIFGKCNGVNSHGHNYKIEVTVKGQIDPVTGMILNITDLKKWIKDEIIEELDHKNLDKDVEYFQNVTSTAENIAVFIWTKLSPIIQANSNKAELYEIKLHETDQNVVVFRGEGL